MKKLISLFLILSMLLCGCSVEIVYGPTEPRPSLDPDSTGNNVLTVHYIDVGQADCILLETDNQFVLIDGGNRDDGQKVISYLESCGVEELEAVIPAHLLTGIDERLSARQGEGEHGHSLHGIAHTLKFGACPGVLVVVGDEHEAVGTLGMALGVLLYIGYQVVDALVALGNIVHHVVQLP